MQTELVSTNALAEAVAMLPECVRKQPRENSEYHMRILYGDYAVRGWREMQGFEARRIIWADEFISYLSMRATHKAYFR